MQAEDGIRYAFFQAEDGIRDLRMSRGLGDVYKRQSYNGPKGPTGFMIPTIVQWLKQQ
ncbi:hypothetical protein JMUB7532_27640 [Staphylococcus aureus]